MSSEEFLQKIINSQAMPDWIDRVCLRYAEETIVPPPRLFDKLNVLFFTKSMSNDKLENLILIQDFGTAALHWAVLAGTLYSYEENYSDPSADILKRMERGDIILIDGKKVKFVGFKDGGQTICFYESGSKKSADCLNMRPIGELRGKINLYAGHAQKPGRFSGRPSKPVPGHPLFTALYGVSSREFSPKTSMLVVTQKKQYLQELEELLISYPQPEGAQYTSDPFAKIVPVVYQKDERNEARILSKRDPRHPLIRVTSSLGAAIEIVRNNANIEKLIVDGDSRVTSHLYELNNLCGMPNLKKKIILLTSGVDKKTLNEIRKSNFTTWLWSEGMLKKLCSKITRSSASGPKKSPFAVQWACLYNNVALKRKIMGVDYPHADAKDLLRSLTKNILFLGHFMKSNKVEALEELAIKARGFKLEVLSPLLISKEESLASDAEEMGKQITSLGELSKSFIYDAAVRKIIDDTCLSVKALEAVFLKSKRTKAENLKAMLATRFGKTAVIFRKIKHALIAREMLCGGRTNLCFLTLNDLKDPNFYDEIIFTGWLGERHADFLSNPRAPLQTYLVYDAEKEMLEYHLSKSALMSYQMSPLEDKASLLGISVDECKNLFEYEAVINNMHKIEEKKHIERESRMEDLIGGIWPSDPIRRDAVSGEKESLVDARLIVFENDSFGFFDEGYSAKVLDRDNGEVVRKELSELAVGDELLFLRDNRRDLFEEIVNALEKENPEVVQRAGAWRIALCELRDKTKASCESLQKVLRDAGMPVELTTLRYWFDPDRVIAPREMEKLMTVLSKLLMRAELDGEKSGIARAVRTVRASHTLAGRHLARAIIGSYGTEGKQKHPWLQSFIKRVHDLTEHVVIVQIQKISEESKPVSTSSANRLLEK